MLITKLYSVLLPNCFFDFSSLRSSRLTGYMLLNLTITNFAIIDRLEVQFDGGFNVLTGETGAGKSIILDAVGLLLGDRARLTWSGPGPMRRLFRRCLICQDRMKSVRLLSRPVFRSATNLCCGG